MSELIKNLPHSTTLTLADQLSVQEGQVSSLTLVQQPGCKVTLFSIDTDQRRCVSVERVDIRA